MTPGNRPSWTYRALMRLFPRAFRAEYGDDMCRLFLERREEAGTSRLARARVWLSGARDLIAHALAERWQGNVSWPKTSLFERRLADLRTALRGLRGAPGFAAAGIGTLALGIGANVAIFTAINSLLLQPLPLQEPERHGLWAEVFVADPDVIGRRIRLAAGAYQTRGVVGVMPESFRPLDPSYRLWSPLERDPSLSMRDDSSWFVNTVVGRLAAGSTIEQASSQVRAVAQTLHEEWPEQFTDGRPEAPRSCPCAPTWRAM